ncbi:unnamed protein product [Discosporangium mesarthrocarpum]
MESWLSLREGQLQRLPLPTLHETLKELAVAVAPFAESEEEMLSFREAIKDFEGGIGPQVQKQLEARASVHENWLDGLWEEHAYLRLRTPKAFFVNWAMGRAVHNRLIRDQQGRAVTQAQAATLLALGLLNFKDMVDRGRLPQEKTPRGEPLCMRQYNRLFRCCVAPHHGCDEIRESPRHSRHVIVTHRGHMFKLFLEGGNHHGDLYGDNDGEGLQSNELPVHPGILLEALQKVLDSMASRAPDMCLLTTLGRDKWADARHHLIRLDRDNVSHLEDIESALFVLSLDDRDPSLLGEEEIASETARLTLLGNGQGRWHDKPFTLVVYKDGTPALNGEHAFADALPVMRAFHHAVSFAEALVGPVLAAAGVEPGAEGVVGVSYARKIEKGMGQGKQVSVPSVWEEGHKEKAGNTNPIESAVLQELRWELDAEARQYVEEASKGAEEICRGVSMHVMRLQRFGRRALKELGIGADGFIQMSIQVASWRIFRRPVAVYEAVHTRRFLHGRTECARPCSAESLAFVRSMHDPSAEAPVRHKLLMQALVRHRSFASRCMAGGGIDRHLFGLEVTQIEEMGEGEGGTHALFSHPLHLRAKKFTVSTSQVSPGELWACYLPSEPNGFGCCYSITDDGINVAISSNATIGGRQVDAHKFGVELGLALQDLFRLCLSQVPSGGLVEINIKADKSRKSHAHPRASRL